MAFSISMPDSKITTNNPLFTTSMGEEVTPEETQVIRDFNLLSRDAFVAKYGQEARDAFMAQSRAAAQTGFASAAAASRDWSDTLTDSAINAAAGAVGGTIDLGAGVAGLLGADKVAEALASASNAVYEGAQRATSPAQQAQQRAYAAYQEALNNRLDRQYKEDLANGKSSTEADLARIGREAMRSVGNIFRSHMGGNIAAQGLGSMVPSWIASAGIGAGMKAGSTLLGKVAPNAVGVTTKALESAPGIVQSTAKAAPWMIASGAVEGGGAYAQQLQEGLSTPINTLVDHSPEFNSRVAELMKQGIPEPQAQEQARRELAFDAAEQAGLRTAAIAGLMGRITEGLSRPFARQGRLAQRIGEGLTEPAEETVTEGATAYFQNQATRDFLDRTQNLTEGIGQGMAEGFVGGLGMTGFQAAPEAAIQAIQGTGQALSEGAGRIFGNRHGIEEEAFSSVDATQRMAEELKDSLPVTQERATRDVANDLSALTEKTFTKVTDEDNNAQYAMSSQEGVQIMDQIQKDKSVIEQDTASPKPFKEQTAKSLGAIERGVQRNVENSFQSAIRSAPKDEDLSNTQAQNLGNLLATMYMHDSAHAEKRFRSLSPKQQEQIRKTSFESSITQEQMNSFLGRDPAVFTSDAQFSTPSQTSSTEDQDAAIYSETSQANDEISTQQISDFEQIYPNTGAPLTRATPEEVQNNNLQQMNPNNSNLYFDKNDQAYYTEDGKDFFKISDEDFDSMAKASSLEEAQRARQNIRARLYKNYPHFAAKINGKHQVFIATSNGVMDASGQYHNVPSETHQKLVDPAVSPEEKAKILSDYLKTERKTAQDEQAKREEQVIRKEEDLSPEVLEKKNQYYDAETGRIGEFDSQEAKKEFAQTNGEGLSKYAVPVKRVINLWKASHPVESLRQSLSSQESILNFFRRNNFTNAGAVFSLITASREQSYKPIDASKSVFNYKDSPINQLLQLLHPKSSFREKFNEKFKITFDKVPAAFKEAFADENGKLRNPERIRELCTIAAIQFMSDLGSHAHDMNQEELSKYNIDYALQGRDNILGSGVYSRAAMNNLATTLRKTFGVAKSNFVSDEDFNSVFGPLAVQVASSLIDAGLVTTSKEDIHFRENGKTVTRALTVLQPADGYQYLFGSQGNILMRFLDPNFKNVWSLEPQGIRSRIHHSNIPLNNKAQMALENLNKMGAKANTYFTNVLQGIGSEWGLIKLFGGEPATDDSRIYTNLYDWKSRKGKDVSERLAFDFIREIQTFAKSSAQKFEDLVLYFNNVMLKNGRIMQEGAATPQSNKTLRVAWNYAKNTVTDLSKNGKKRNVWKMILAQNLGVKVNKKQFGSYKNTVDEALRFIAEQTGEKGRYRQLVELINDNEIKYDGVKVPEKNSELPDSFYLLKGLIEDFNKRFDKDGLGIHDVYGLNALIEGIRFNEAQKNNALNNFDSRIFLEIDGTNDGPSNINSLYGLVMGSFSDRFMLTNAKTGNHIGMDTTTQETMTKGTKSEQLYGTEGRDLHEEVSAQAVAQNFVARVQAALDDAKNEGLVGDNALRQLWATYHILQIFKHLGWIDKNPLKPRYGEKTADFGETDSSGNPIRTTKKNQLLGFDADLSNFVFTRDVSKVLTTVIPYGSEVTGTTRQLVTTMMTGLGSKPGIYSKISEGISAVAHNKDIPQDCKEILKSFRILMGMRYDDGNFTLEPIDDKAATNLRTNFPSLKELQDGGTLIRGSLVGKREKQGNSFVGDFIPSPTLQNFELTALGHEQLTHLFLPIIGEPAQAAVNSVMGTDAMRGAKLPALMSEIINILRQAKETQMASTSGGSLKNLAGKAWHQAQKALRRLSPVVTFDSGSQIFVHKEKFTTDATPLYKQGDLEYVSSDVNTASTGVSGGPLTTQAAGDGSMVMYSLAEMVKQGIEALQVFDGVYVQANDAEIMGKILNQGSLMAQQQHVIHDLLESMREAGKALIKHEGFTHEKYKNSPLLTVVDALANYLSGSQFDGSPRSIRQSESRQTYERLHRSIYNFMNPSTFIPSLRESLAERRNGRDLNFVKKEENKEVSKQVKEDLKELFIRLRAIEINEEIQHEVMDLMPKSIHHMSGMDSTYKYGKPLKPAEWETVMEELRKEFPEMPYASVNELMQAFMNRAAREIFDRKFRKDLTGNKAIITLRWEQLTGRDMGNTGYFEITNDDLFNAVAKKLRVLNPKDVAPRDTSKGYFSPQWYKTDDLKSCFTRLALDRKEESILVNLYGKLSKALPQNLQLCLVADPRDLPATIRGKFANRKTNGLYVNEGGKGTIYVVSWTGDNNIHRTNGPLARTIVHEMIHAVVSAHLVQYFRYPQGLTAIQRKAIKNLKDLLKDFMDESRWDSDDVPQEIAVLRDRLSKITDPAERLDESLAYILSNEALLREFANYKLKAPLKHQRRLGNLIRHVLDVAKKVWKNLLNIVTNSPMDKALSTDEGVSLLRDKKRRMNFLQLYGANTMVLVDEIIDMDNTDPDKSRKIRKNPKNQGFERKMVNDMYQTFERTPDFFNLLSDRIRSSTSFDAVAQKIKVKGSLDVRGIQKTSVERVNKELGKINAWRDNFASHMQSYLDHPKEFAETFVQLMDRDSMSDTDRYALYKAGKRLIESLNPQSFIEDPLVATQEEINASQEIYEMLTGDSSFYSRIKDLSMPESFNPQAVKQSVLLALAMTHPKINEVLGKAVIPNTTTKRDWLHNPWETFKNLQDEIIASWERNLAKDKTLKDAVTVVHEKSLESPEDLHKVFNPSGIFKALDNALKDLIAKSLRLIGKEDLGFAFILAKKAPIQTQQALMEGVRNTVNAPKNIALAEFVRDIYGRVPSNTGVETFLKQIKGYYDKLRQQNLESIPEFLRKEFVNNKADKKLGKFLYRVLGKANVISLDETTLKNVALSSAALDQRINQEYTNLTVMSPEFASLYRRKIEELAGYLMGTREASHNLLTNAEAIARLFGEIPQRMPEPKQEIISTINRLISLYCLKNLSTGDKLYLKNLYLTDGEAMVSMQRQLKQVYEDELTKIQHIPNKYYKCNYVTGWMPRGSAGYGHYTLVKQSAVQKYKKKGYKVVGRYDNSNIDTSEPVYCMYNDLPLEERYQETLLQGINDTSFGFLHHSLSRNEVSGGLIRDEKACVSIFKNFDKETSGIPVIPIYNERGNVVGYEKAVPREHRAKYLEKDADLFTGLAQYKSRQRRELLAQAVNETAILMAAEQYNNASPKQRQQYIDILHSEDPIIQKGIRRLGPKTRQLITKYFGDHFFLRADEVNTFLGFPEAHLTDMWTGDFFLPKGMQKAMVTTLEGIFGERAQYFVGRAEELLNIVMSYARDTIVIRSGIVPLVNALSNSFLLFLTLGMPPHKIKEYYKRAVAATIRYNNLVERQQKVEYELDKTKDEARKTVLKKELNDIIEEIQQLPIYRLVKEGEYSTISVEGTIYEGANVMKEKIDTSIENAIENLGKGSTAKKVLSELLMTKKSTSYQTMAEIVNMSDWVAKCAGYWYLREGATKLGGKAMSHEQARNTVSTLFVDYDQPVGRLREWTNRSGLTWFMTYKYRMISAALMSLAYNPSRTLMGSMVAGAVPMDLLGGTPLTENILYKLFSGSLDYSLMWGTFFRGLSMHPLAVVMGLLT